MAYQDKFLDVDGLAIRYIEAGSERAVICLHGVSLCASAELFDLNPFHRLAAGLLPN